MGERLENSEDIKTAAVNGIDLAYIERGSGDPVIFVHGSQGDYRTWRKMVEAFSKKYRAIAYSRRYHYPNSWVGDGTDYSVDLHANDLIALIEAMNVVPAYVVGNSYGAYTTLLAAIRRPEFFRKIVVGEPPILPWLQQIPGGERYYDGFMSRAWLPAKEAFQQGTLEAGVRLFVDGVSGPGDYERLPEEVKTRFMQNARELQAETLSPDYFTEITPQQLEQLKVPVLLLKGEESPKMFHLIVDRLAELIPSARLETIPHTSHSLYSGNPQGYTQTVMGFLDGG
jgi:pimeloyl-ACP methyl ester carboxylesterase